MRTPGGFLNQIDRRQVLSDVLGQSRISRRTPCLADINLENWANEMYLRVGYLYIYIFFEED